MSKLERALATALAVVAVVVLTGTVYAGLSGSRARKLAREAVPAAAAGRGVYDGLGRLRARTADEAVVVVDLAFPYDASDRQFREELNRRRGDLREAVVGYLSSRRADELGSESEPAVKAALRDTLNAILSLGSVEELYFAEFNVIQ